jgi:ABC-type thiamine transport system ATPase subunit
VPAPKTLGDMLSGGNGEEAAARTMLPIRPTIEFRMDSLFAQLSPELQRQMASHIRLGQLLQKRPVVLISPYTVTVK